MSERVHLFGQGQEGAEVLPGHRCRVAVLLIATVVQNHFGEYSPLVRGVIGGVVALVLIGLAFALGKYVGTARSRR
ncbi:hypothetical protein FVA95_25740 [Pseudonocardia sp. EV170527-09]|uniref:hypothetical protein n=1 Tax=Pseudonocardia sp. EV170527-09 TaxID=2603411 RepID=UPI0011F24A81|nr:hypothetical protein [Pseudonocardia sp. EV170527-09]KAA1015762.1 hypothetical protein FVA95_25740 [Pseudonocardia sp. EV170527-09]